MKQRIITSFEIIRCFFWKLKNRMVFRIRTIPPVIDAGDLCRIRYIVYVNKDGNLMFQTFAFTAKILGVCEWRRESKRLSRIAENKVVIDMLVNPLSHVESE